MQIEDSGDDRRMDLPVIAAATDNGLLFSNNTTLGGTPKVCQANPNACFGAGQERSSRPTEAKPTPAATPGSEDARQVVEAFQASADLRALTQPVD
jgi:hypothetical protein